MPNNKFRWPILMILVGVIIVFAYPIYATEYRRETTLYDSVNSYMLVSRDASSPAWAFATGLFGRGLHLNFTAVTSWPVNETPQNFENRNTIAVFNKTFGNRTYEFWFRINKTGQIDNDGILAIGAISTGGATIAIDTFGSGKLRISSTYAGNVSLAATAYQAKRIDVGDAFWTSRGLIAYWPFNGTGNSTHFKEFANGGASYWARFNGTLKTTTYGYYPWDNSTSNNNRNHTAINITQYNLLNRTRGSIVMLVKINTNYSTGSNRRFIIQSGEHDSTIGVTTNDTAVFYSIAASSPLISFGAERQGVRPVSPRGCSVSSSNRYKSKQWYHLVFTWSTNASVGQCKLWINGSVAGSDNDAYLNSSYTKEYAPFTYLFLPMARTSAQGNFTIDELAIFSQQLNQSDIQKIAWSNFTDNQWHHVALEHGVYGNKGNIGFFVDGRKYAQWNNTNTTHLNPATGNYIFEVGCDALSCSTPAVNTIIDNLRVSNITRFGMFNGSFTPKKYMISDRNTLAFWTFDYPINQTDLRFCNSLQYNEAVALNVTFHDEVNSSKFNNITSVTGNFRLQGHINSSQIGEINLSQANPRHLSLCITPATENFKVNASIKIAKNGWNYRHFYYDYRINNLTNITLLSKWYLLQSSLATLITLKITDSLDSPLSDILTEVQKYYLANDTWNTIGMTKSGEDGQDAIYLQQNEVDYRFNVFQDGESVKLTAGQKITAATYTIKLIPSTLTDLISNVKDLITNMTYNNHTKTFSYGYYDPNSKLAGACLQVGISNTTGNYFKPTSCQYGSYRGIISLTPGNSTPSTSTGYGYIIMNGSILNFGKQTLQVIEGLRSHATTWGKYGLFLLMCLLVGLVMTQIGSPSSAIVAAMVVLFAAWWMDIFNVSTLVFTGLMIGLGLIIKELRSG